MSLYLFVLLALLLVSLLRGRVAGWVEVRVLRLFQPQATDARPLAANTQPRPVGLCARGRTAVDAAHRHVGPLRRRQARQCISIKIGHAHVRLAWARLNSQR